MKLCTKDLQRFTRHKFKHLSSYNEKQILGFQLNQYNLIDFIIEAEARNLSQS